MHRPGEFCCVFVTAPSVTVARKIAAAVLKERLAACANLLPKVESHYWWQGQLESSAEVLILFKTTRGKLGELEKAVMKNHPYETPEFIAVKLEHGAERYMEWIRASVGEAGKGNHE